MNDNTLWARIDNLQNLELRSIFYGLLQRIEQLEKGEPK